MVRNIMPSRSRQFRKLQDDQASWDRLREAPWSPLQVSRASGSGKNRLQLVRLPSFSPPIFWEICQREPHWFLYSSKVVDPSSHALMVQGYELTSFDGGRLKNYFDRLTSLQLPVAPDMSGMSGLDGTVTQLRVYGDLWSHVEYQWWSNPPPAWTPLVKIVDEMFEVFDDLNVGE